MLGDPIGYVIVDKELKYTKEPGFGGLDPQTGVSINLTEEYFNALKLKMVPVMDTSVDGSEYTVFGEGPHGGFLWFLDKRDTISELIPYNILYPNKVEDSMERLIRIFSDLEKGKLSKESFDWICKEAERMGFKV
jgi:hypothetical protein